ncbi:YfbU family protein [Corynebacterium cystitidis]|uniref:YfbU family protein n=1 Tax=Corynebacterium cystitidis TaxID=35757 RepID=UPI00211E7A54|nr:YfbU family protein [Corynebacterium cystitidis]
MFRILGTSSESHGGWEKIPVVDAERYGVFRGLGGNDILESKMLSYVHYLVKTGRWEKQAEFISKGRGNSHTRMLPTYRAMLSRFEPIWRNTIRSGLNYRLSENDITDVLLSAPGVQPTENE